MTEATERYRRYLETLTPESLTVLETHVVPGVRFVDPFNDVTGVEAMRAVFRHMFKVLGDVAFEVRHMAIDGNVALMAWTFRTRLRGRAWVVEGASEVTFDPQGRVISHIDRWDAGRDFYELLPVIGGPMRWLRRRAAGH